MDTGRIIDNFKFYHGFEGETEVIFQNSVMRIHVWEGYVDDIVGNPPLDGMGWHGLTRDYNQMEGPFSNDSGEVDSGEYLSDLKTYLNKHFDTPTSKELLLQLIELFQTSVDQNEKVRIEVS